MNLTIGNLDPFESKLLYFPVMYVTLLERLTYLTHAHKCGFPVESVRDE